MTTLLLLAIVILTVAICAFAAFWFLRDAKAREQKRKPAYGARGSAGHYSWDGGTRTSRNRR